MWASISSGDIAGGIETRGKPGALEAGAPVMSGIIIGRIRGVRGASKAAASKDETWLVACDVCACGGISGSGLGACWRC